MRLSLRRRPPVVIPVEVAPQVPERHSDGTVVFQTEAARRRFVPVPITSPVVELHTRDGRLGRRTTATVTLTALPDTVSCGGGYLEVLWAVPDGLVVNEVRTHGDLVHVTPLPGWVPGPPILDEMPEAVPA